MAKDKKPEKKPLRDVVTVWATEKAPVHKKDTPSELHPDVAKEYIKRGWFTDVEPEIDGDEETTNPDEEQA